MTDAIFRDGGVTGDKNTHWANENNNLTVTTDSTGTTISTGSNSYGHYWANDNNNIAGSFVCEFDLLEYTDDRTVTLRLNATSNHYLIFKDRNIQNGSHIKISYDGKVATFQVNDNTPVNWFSASYDSIRIALRVYATNESIKYKNFMIYGI